MREILFRGKSIEDNKWVYGDLIREKKSFGKICTRIYRTTNNGWELIDVDSKTVGQYTGLNDKNGNKIFEGDIIKQYFKKLDSKYPEYNYCFYDIGGVFWHPHQVRFLRTSKLFTDTYPKMFDHYEYEIIGNIYDNPELLEE